MLRYLLPSLLLTMGAIACSGRSSPAPDDPQQSYEETESASSKKGRGGSCGSPAPACASTGGGCKTDTDCCAGACNYDSYGPVSSHCYPPGVDGSYCMSDRACASGHCDNYECKPAAPACDAIGTKCTASSSCCNGFCDTNTYGPWKCVAKRPVGQWCEDASECQSGSCVSYLCK